MDAGSIPACSTNSGFKPLDQRLETHPANNAGALRVQRSTAWDMRVRFPGALEAVVDGAELVSTGVAINTDYRRGDCPKQRKPTNANDDAFAPKLRLVA